MAIKVNLLPSDQRVGKDLAQVLRVTKMLGVIALGVFIVFVMGIGAYFIFSSVQLSNLNTANNTLKDQVLSLKTSENKMTLLKDRIAKIKTVQKIPTAVANLDSIDTIIAPLSTESSVNELDVSSSKVSASINFKSNIDLAGFLTSLSDSKSFQTVNLSSFSFNPASGYLVSVAIAGNK